MAATDKDADNRESDAGNPPKPATAATSAVSTEEAILVELKEIRRMLAESRGEQSRYLWILFPIGAILVVQTILEATHF